MENKDFIKGLKNGLGFSLAIFIIVSILFGVYAFVEPSQGPSVGSNYLEGNQSSLLHGTIDWSDCETITASASGDGGTIDTKTCSVGKVLVSHSCYSVVDDTGITNDLSGCNLHPLNPDSITDQSFDSNMRVVGSAKCCKLR